MTSDNQGEASVAALGAHAMEIGTTMSEIAAASGYVVATRIGLIGTAMGNPIEGDYREMRRMVPEKMLALAHSGIALFEGVGALQRDVAAQAMDMALLAFGGVPSAARLARLAEDSGRRGSRAMMWPVATGAAAIRPLHRTVTANARRLGAPA